MLRKEPYLRTSSLVIRNNDEGTMEDSVEPLRIRFFRRSITLPTTDFSVNRHTVWSTD